MSYEVLARKWRPSNFEEIVGQQDIVVALRNGLKESKIAQAYLFSGIRGVGKTTAARVLAKALNCQKSSSAEEPAADPCNECAACIEITDGRNLDVLEVDAATYSRVEQIRELTDSLRYGPAHNRYKVVVLDEIHRLSRQAFDALLKIVEEPPSHLVFIFATTESDAIPATIHSRCQEFQFRRVNSSSLAKHLGRISEAEGINVSESALQLIARAGEGSVRDSVALLDQLATFGNGNISDSTTHTLLGGLNLTACHRLLASILSRDLKSILSIVEEVADNGSDPYRIYGSFLTYVHEALQLSLTEQPESLDLPRDQTEELAQLLRNVTFESLLRLSHFLLTSEPSVRRSEFGVLAIKLVWLRAAELSKLTRIETLLNSTDHTPSKPNSKKKASEIPSETNQELAEPARYSREKSTPGPRIETGRKAQELATTETYGPSPKPSPDKVKIFRRKLEVASQSLSALLVGADITLDEKQLIIKPSKADLIATSALERKTNQALITKLVASVFGTECNWKVAAVTAKTTSENSLERSELEDSKRGNVKSKHSGIVEVVLEIFQGNITEIQTPGEQLS